MVLLRPPLLRAEERLLDFLEEDFRLLLRPPLLRRDDFLPDDLRAPPLRLLLARLRVAALLRAALFRRPRLRPEDPDRELFRRRELLDFLAAAIGMLRVGRFVERIARFAHNNTARRYTAARGMVDRATRLANRACLAVSHDPELVFVETGGAPLRACPLRRFIHRLVSQLERCPMGGRHH